MAANLTQEHSTPATLSTLPLATIRDIVATLQAEAPAEHARISRGVEVLLACKIVETGELGRYLVQSTRDGVLYYECTSWACSCPDRQRHAEDGQRCKHSWALVILSAASAVASRERAENASPDAFSCQASRERAETVSMDTVSCQACHTAPVNLDGLCLDCLAREADVIDVDQPISFAITPLGMAALDPAVCAICGHDVAEHDTYQGVRRCGGCPDWQCQPDRATVLAWLFGDREPAPTVA
jgi:hypothetical protein